jgi:CHAD domain-containing protein
MATIDKAASERVKQTVEELARSREGRLAAGAASAAAAALAVRQLTHGQRDASPDPSRKYRLRRREPVGFGLRRVARGRLEHAVELLRDQDADPVEAVHESRKDMKKLRSALRLVRPVLGDGEYSRDNGRYRDAAAKLSAVRDAQVRAETIEALAERFADEPPPGGWGAIHKALVVEEQTEDLEALRAQAADEIEAGRRELRNLSIDGTGAAALCPGLRRAYARGRRRFREAAAKPTDERLHEWRKRSKDLWYHLRLVRAGWRPVLEPLADQAHELSDLLGDDHDLAVLTSDLGELGGSLEPAQRIDLEGRIAARRSELQSGAFALGERLYAERPKEFAKRIAAYWEAERV